jgi:hypothetical protein
MKREEINSLIKLREFLIKEHKNLDGRTSPNTAIIKQSYVASIIEETVKSLDAVLKSHVTFQSKES